ncbi:MAG: hypothetical protein WC444_00940 [Candidatus Paceibacterota bacterium]
MEEIFLPLHFIALAFVAWNVFHADHMGFNWIQGKVEKLDARTVEKYHKRTWIGLLLMIGTGVALFWPEREFLLARPQFYIKMAFVATLFLNSFAIGNLKEKSTTRAYASLSVRERIPLFLSGALSTISWLGAAVMALFLIPD